MRVGDKILSAPKVLIAVGGAPTLPAVPGASEWGITSDGFFEMEQQPRSVAVFGAGYIAVELAGVLRGLGTDVTLFTRKDGALRSFDSLVRPGQREEGGGAGWRRDMVYMCGWCGCVRVRAYVAFLRLPSEMRSPVSAERGMLQATGAQCTYQRH